MQHSATISRSTDDPHLDIREAAATLTAELGRSYSYNQVRRGADQMALPFFKDPLTGKRVIRRSLLLSAWTIAQSRAVSAFQKSLSS
jgi:hypothetical protein